VPTVKARHEIGGIAPHMLTTSALYGDERLVSRPGYFTPEEIATLYPLNGAEGGFRCRSGCFGEEKTLSSPYENRNTNSLLLGLWSSHCTNCARGAREQFGRRYSHACSQLAYWCHAYFTRVFYLIQ
jgi:hypothetical protein